MFIITLKGYKEIICIIMNSSINLQFSLVYNIYICNIIIKDPALKKGRVLYKTLNLAIQYGRR